MTGEPNGFEAFEHDLTRLGRYLDYPATPDLAARVAGELRARPGRFRLPVSGRQARWLAVAAAVLLAAALVAAVWSDARTAVAHFFGLSRVGVIPGPAVPAPTVPPPAAPEFAGRTTLAEARARAGFPVRLPTYPEGLGEPDEVYFQELFAPGEAQVILVYRTRPGIPGSSDLLFRLYEARTTGLFLKGPVAGGTVVREVAVDGSRGYWLENATHPIRFRDPGGQERVELTRLVTGNVLAWEVGDLTYRLETNLPLEEAVKVARSLKEAR